MEDWPEVRLIPEDSGFFRRALAVAVASMSPSNKTTWILPQLKGKMGAMGPFEQIPGGIKVDPTFMLVFKTVVSLTVALAIGCVLLALFAQPPTEEIRSLISFFKTLIGTGFGAVAGLIGGRAPPRPRRSSRSK
jgi:hypothetical protein